MLSDVLSVLRCPTHLREVEEPLYVEDTAVRCSAGHSFDIAARHGYVNLTVRDPKTGDSAAMVHSREAWLDHGHYAPLSQRLAILAGQRRGGVIADVGAGTGHYLAAALEASGHAVGLALDLSRYAARRAATRHPRIGSVVADVWSPLPVKTDSIDVLMNVFAPRNGSEFARILRSDGVLVVATPASHHLTELSAALGLLSVDRDKQSRLDSTLRPWFHRTSGPSHSERLEFALRLSRHEAVEAVTMGPSSWHISAETASSTLADMSEPIVTTAAFELSCWIPRTS